MASPALLKRLAELEARLGSGAQVTVGTVCLACGANVALDAEGRGPCPNHHPLPPAETVLLVTFRSPHAEP